MFSIEQLFSTFSSHGMCKVITKILQHTEKYISDLSDKKLDVILIHLHWTAIVALAVVIFFI